MLAKQGPLPKLASKTFGQSSVGSQEHLGQEACPLWPMSIDVARTETGSYRAFQRGGMTPAWGAEGKARVGWAPDELLSRLLQLPLKGGVS